MYLTNHYFLSFPDDIHGRLRDRKMIPAVFPKNPGSKISGRHSIPKTEVLPIGILFGQLSVS